jgi:hypothetical protein
MRQTKMFFPLLFAGFIFLFAAVARADDEYYVNPGGEAYHRPGCKFITKQATAMPLEQAAVGRRPCRTCLPPIPGKAPSSLSAEPTPTPKPSVQPAPETQPMAEGTFSSAVAPAPAPAALSNDDVVAMVNANLGPEIIVAKIKASFCNFDTSPATLQKLKSGGVSDSVVLAMVQAPVGSGGSSQASVNLAEPIKQPAVTTVQVPDGTPVEIELKSTVSSEDVEPGSVVDFAVIQPVKVDGVTVIERGAPAKARIAAVKKARHWGRAGNLSWSMQDVQAVDGNRIPLRFEKGSAGAGSSGKVAVGVVVTSIVFWPAAPLWGLKKGKPAVIPAGKRFEVFVNGESLVQIDGSSSPSN